MKKAIDKYRLASAIEDLMVVNDDKTRNKNEFFYNLSLNSLFYIDIIRFYEGITVSKIADIIGVSKSAVTIKMSELEKKGYVIKVKDTKDKRIKYLSLSDKMRAIYDEFDNEDAEIIKEIKEKYTEKQTSDFCDILNYLSDKVLGEEEK